MADFKVIGNTELNTDGMKSGMANVGSIAKKGFGIAAAATGALVAGVTLATKALWEQAKATAETTDRIDKMSQKIGISREAFQEWDYVISQNGGNVDGLAIGMKKLSVLTDEAINGGEAQVETFKRLGISMETVKNSSPEEVFELSIKALQGMEESAERTALANDLLGKSAIDLAPLLNATAESTQELKDQAREYGLVVSDEVVDAGVQFTDSLDKLKRTMEALKTTAIAELLPSFTMITDGFAGLVAGTSDGSEIGGGIELLLQKLEEALPKLLGFVEMLIQAIVPMIPTILQTFIEGMIKIIPSLIPVFFNAFLQIFQSLLKMLPQLVQMGMSMIVSLMQGIAQVLPEIIPTIVDVVLQMIEVLIENLPMFIEAGISIILGLVDGLIQAIPVIIEALPRIIGSIITAVIEAIPLLIEGAIALVLGLVQALPLIIMALVQALPTIIIAVVEGLVNAIPILIQGAIALIMGLVEALPLIIMALIEAIPLIITSVIEALITAIPMLIKGAIELVIGIVKALPQIILALIKAIPTIIVAIIEAFASMGTDFKNMGTDLVVGLWNGLKEKWEWLKDKAKELATGLIDGFKGIFGIESPSKEFAWIGKMNMEGLEKGMEDNNPFDQMKQNLKAGLGSLQNVMQLELNGSVRENSAVAGTSGSIINNFYDTQTSPDAIARTVGKTMTFGLARAF